MNSDLESLGSSIVRTRRQIDQRVGEAKSILSESKRLQTEISNLDSRIETLNEAIAVLQSVADRRQTQLQDTIQSLVTEGLRAVFGQDYEFKIVPSTKGKLASLDFYIRSRMGEGWIETPITDSRGGGVAAVAGFLLRVVVLLLQKDIRKTLFLDEVFGMVSASAEQALVGFVRELVDRLDFQVVLVTHNFQDSWMEVADNVYQTKLVNGETKIERVIG